MPKGKGKGNGGKSKKDTISYFQAIMGYKWVKLSILPDSAGVYGYLLLKDFNKRERARGSKKRSRRSHR